MPVKKWNENFSFDAILELGDTKHYVTQWDKGGLLVDFENCKIPIQKEKVYSYEGADHNGPLHNQYQRRGYVGP